MRRILAVTIVLPLIGAIPSADGQTVRADAPEVAGKSAPLPAGTPLGGLGRRTLGGTGSVRIEGQPPPPPLPPPPRPPAPASAFRSLADAIDQRADPR